MIEIAGCWSIDVLTSILMDLETQSSKNEKTNL